MNDVYTSNRTEKKNNLEMVELQIGKGVPNHDFYVYKI